MGMRDMQLLARGRYPYSTVFPLAEMVRHVASHYPVYADNYLTPEAVPFTAFILTQLW